MAQLLENKCFPYTDFQHKLINFVLFPVRACFLNPISSGAKLLSLRDERMYYVSRHVKGRNLDIGCGPYDRFTRDYATKGSVGIDFFQYPGLTPEQVVPNPPKLPFKDNEFDSATLIANINHIPRNIFPEEMREVARIVKPGGTVVITRIGLVVSFLTHSIVHLQSHLSKKYYSMDHERGMEEDERLTVPVKEMMKTLEACGLVLSKKESLWTQWGLNEIFVFTNKE